MKKIEFTNFPESGENTNNHLVNAGDNILINMDNNLLQILYNFLADFLNPAGPLQAPLVEPLVEPVVSHIHEISNFYPQDLSYEDYKDLLFEHISDLEYKLRMIAEERIRILLTQEFSPENEVHLTHEELIILYEEFTLEEYLIFEEEIKIIMETQTAILETERNISNNPEFDFKESLEKLRDKLTYLGVEADGLYFDSHPPTPENLLYHDSENLPGPTSVFENEYNLIDFL